MSTVPGHDAWRDAGLDDIEETPGLLDETLGEPGVEPGVGQDRADEYVPPVARPDRAGAADEADVVEQALEVPVDDEDPTGPEQG